MTDTKKLEIISKQLMRTLTVERWNKASNEEKQLFFQRNASIIEAVYSAGKGQSATALAAACKCAVFYGTDKVVDFLQRLKKQSFNGRDDPVMLYFTWLESKYRIKKLTNTIIFQMTVAALQAFCEGKTIKTLSPRKKDVFDWTDSWEYNPEKRYNSIPPALVQPTKPNEIVELIDKVTKLVDSPTESEPSVEPEMEPPKLEPELEAIKTEILTGKLDNEFYELSEVAKLTGQPLRTLQTACKDKRFSEAEKYAAALFYCRSKGADATMTLADDGRFIVKQGSIARKKDAPLAHLSTICGYRRRKTLMEEGVLSEEGGELKFTRDYAFESLSMAGQVVCGRTSSGRKHDWKTKEGKSFDEVASRWRISGASVRQILEKGIPPKKSKK